MPPDGAPLLNPASRPNAPPRRRAQRYGRRMPVEIRAVRDDELGAWTDAVHVGFLAPQRRGERPAPGRDRYVGGFDGAAVVATLRGIELHLSVPGGARVAACGITSVTVAQTHRRAGILTRMMTRELDAARDRGEPLAALVTSQWPLYGRFGFGPAVYKTGVEIDASALRLARELPSTVGFADPAAARAHAPALYDRAGDRLAGVVDRCAEDWDRHFGLLSDGQDTRPQAALHLLARDEAGAVAGYASYTVAEQWTRAERPTCTVKVKELIADSVPAEALLWSFLAGHDWVAAVSAGGQPVDAPWPLLLQDARAVHYTHRVDALWLRVLDPAAALAARRYEVPGRLVLRVHDPAGYAQGTFLLDGGPGGAECRRTREDPDLTVPVDVLACLFLGGESAVRLAAAGRLAEERPGALARAEVMLRTARAPWRPTSF
jgi:predicted acetyltransferase